MKVNKPQRRSRQREVIEHELSKLTTHPTAAELYEIVRERLPKVSLGTVYRNLEQLAEIGAIRKLTNGSSVRYDADVTSHYHVRCVRCDKVGDVFDLPDDAGSKYQNLAGYKILSVNMEFLGICPECQQVEVNN